MKSRYLALPAVISLALVACGGDEAEDPDTSAEGNDASTEEDEGDGASDEESGSATLDCDSIEFMVPYSPGGGSDRQVRRLEGALAEYFETEINIVYREGANGAVAWQALHGSEPDGCTVSNVVYPNIVLASMEDDEETFAADDFTHLGQTETAPQTIAVALDSEFETIEQFLTAAEENPGEITVGGTGKNGEVLNEQIAEATGLDMSYVPMEGGVGDTIPLLAGGHVDAAMFSSSHIESNPDTIRALVLAGDEPAESPNLKEIPTFGSLGYEGVDMATSWGVLGPPEMSEEIAQIWNDAIQYAVDNEEMRQTLIDNGLTPLYTDLEGAAEFNRNVMAAFGLD